MGVLVPLFAFGVALIGIPYFVHRIRRPERETVRFSSLMFVPDVKREVIERRRVQHVVLMLLRMAVLVALALAFARPFQEMMLNAEAVSSGTTDHVIAMDVSLSMGYDGVWERAKMGAKAVLETVEPGDRVGFVRFAQQPVVDVPLSGDVADVRHAIEIADVTWGYTDYAAALQAVEHVFAADTAQVKRVVHVISDFQASGMPVSDMGWRLPGAIELQAVDVGIARVSNASVDALAVRAVKDDVLRVRARVRNWSGQGGLAAQLVVDGEVIETRDVTVLPGNATQVAFSVPLEEGINGYVALAGADGLQRDDRRFFAWLAKPQHPIAVLNTSEVTQFMLKAAAPEGADWRLVWSGELIGSVVIAEDVTSVSEFADYVEEGGALFLPLRRDADIQSVNALLARANIRVSGVADAGYAALAWVNLEHPIFRPFKGARFNDFSSVRYENYHVISTDSSAAVLAKYDDLMPAIVEGRIGAGRIVVWGGGMGFDRSNLARTPRFVPLLHETLRYLSGDREIETDYQVGDAINTSDAVERVMGPEGSDSVVGDARIFHAPGVYQWGTQIASVNVAERESDLARITPAEFEIRLCDTPVLFQRDGEQSADLSIVYEYGRWVLGFLLILLLLEHFYAAYLSAREVRT